MKEALVTDAQLEWEAVLGCAFVVSDPCVLRAAATATFPTTQRVRVILRPKTRSEVCEVVRIANDCRFPLYPISTGKNWGYGSRVPTQDNCALLDLSRMNRITGFHESLGYVTVQPGVTQNDLFTFLREQNSNLWMDATGSSPDCSLIGNAMERGFGHTPYGDHFANVCGLEVVLPNGDVVKTGFSGLPHSRAGQVYKWGLGPSFDSLFSQSNLGIVTEMTIWLMPAPACFQAFFFQSDSEQSLHAIVEALRPLRLDGTLRSAVHIGNDYKVLAGIQQFPWEEQQPLSPERMKVLRQNIKISRWSGSGALYGSPGQVAEARRLVRAALSGKVAKLQFIDDRTLSFATRFKRPYQWLTGLDLSRTLELLRPVYGLLKGIPTKQTLGSAYWRKRTPVPLDPDPDRDGCGVIWLSPVASMEGQEAVKLVGMAERTLLAHGFEPLISITLLTERALACIISITYDREVAGEDAKAMACYHELREALECKGYYSYRLGVAGMPMQSLPPSHAKLLRSIKKAVDPNLILAPGRYIPLPANQEYQ